MDLIESVLPQLYQRRLTGLNLAADFVHPAYSGYSILNIPSSICHWLGAPPIAAEPLGDTILHQIDEAGIQRVVLVIIDALALERLQRWQTDGTAPLWGESLQSGILAPLTSITPSTTSAAITSLWSGRSPSEHGLTGYEMWFKEFGVSGNTITHSVMSFPNDPGGLERAGFKAEEALPFPALGTHLAAHGVETAVFQPASIVHSGLSRTILKDIKIKRYYTASDLWVNLRNWLETRSKGRSYAYVYWPELDTLSHVYGPDDERTAAEFGQFSAACERLFLHRLSPAQRQGTLLILTADHGMVMTHPDPYYDLSNHPGLLRRLHLKPTGENRLVYLHIRPGQTEAVREYLERTWPNQFQQIDSAYAVETGLFGSGTPHPGLLDRVGDLILAAKGNAYLWWANKENRVYGRHGGLGAQEMLVPFLAVRL